MSTPSEIIITVSRKSAPLLLRSSVYIHPALAEFIDEFSRLSGDPKEMSDTSIIPHDVEIMNWEGFDENPYIFLDLAHSRSGALVTCQFPTPHELEYGYGVYARSGLTKESPCVKIMFCVKDYDIVPKRTCITHVAFRRGGSLDIMAHDLIGRRYTWSMHVASMRWSKTIMDMIVDVGENEHWAEAYRLTSVMRDL